jgi:hypothetical protein
VYITLSVPMIRIGFWIVLSTSISPHGFEFATISI